MVWLSWIRIRIQDQGNLPNLTNKQALSQHLIHYLLTKSHPPRGHTSTTSYVSCNRELPHVWCFLFVKDETSCTLWTRSPSSWPSCAGSNTSQQSEPPSCPAFSSRFSFLQEIESVSRIRDVYPWSWFLPIPDPGSRIQKQEQKRGVKTNFLLYLFCSHKFHKIVNYFIFEILKTKIWPISKEL